jgi:hypothetical protein
MKVTAVAVTYGRKINLEQYGFAKFNSMHLEVSAWADLEDGDDFAQVEAQLREQCRLAVKSEAQRIIKQNNPQQQKEEQNG